MWNLVTTMNNIKLKYHNGKTTLRMRDDNDDDNDATRYNEINITNIWNERPLISEHVTTKYYKESKTLSPWTRTLSSRKNEMENLWKRSVFSNIS